MPQCGRSSPPVFDFSINSQAGAGKCAAFPTAETEGKKENKVQMPPSFAGKEGEESRCSHIPKQALIKMEGKHGGGDEMTRRERGKQGILERAAPILQPVALFFGLLLLLSLVGRSIGGGLIEQIALSFILIAVADDAGFLVSRQSTHRAWMVAGAVTAVFLGILCLGALFLYSETPGLKDLLLTGARILAGALAGAVIGEKKRPRRKK